MDPYETLGVPKDADADTVKKAYRRRVAKAHPDRGGSADEAAKVNDAYAVLADPARRQQYDETGEAGLARSEEDEATEMLMSAFASEIDAPEGKFLQVVRAKLAHLEAQGNGAVASLRVRGRKLERRRDATKVTGNARNLVHQIIGQQLEHIRQETARIDRNLSVLALAIKMLDGYGSDEAPPVRVTSPFDAEISRFFVTGTGARA